MLIGSHPRRRLSYCCSHALRPVPSAVLRLLRYTHRRAATCRRFWPRRSPGDVFCYYGIRGCCGDVAEEIRMQPQDSEAMRMDHLCRMRCGDVGVALHSFCRMPDMNAIISGKDTDPVAHNSPQCHGRGGVSCRARRRSRILSLVRIEHAGRRKSSCLLRVRAR